MTTLFVTIGLVLLMLPSFVFIAMMLPGVLYLFIIAVIYGLFDHFAHLSLNEIAILGVIAVASVIVDQIAGFIGAHWGGARGKTFIFGIAGVMLGNVFFPILGGFVGLFVGIFIGETIRRQKISQNVNSEKNLTSETDAAKDSLKAATAGVLGAVSGIVINICLATVFIIAFFIFIF